MGSHLKTKNPSKQRNRINKASSFHRHKLMSVRVSKELRKKYKVKKISVRKGDTVYVTAGDFVGTEGKYNPLITKIKNSILKVLHVRKRINQKLCIQFMHPKSLFVGLGRWELSEKPV